MKVSINIKNNSNLHPHQTLNKRKWLMKRESGRSPTHHFSFGERFDETLMKYYSVSYQYIRLSNHQFIGISALIKSAVERQHNPCLYAVAPTGNHAGTMARNIIQGWRKKKGPTTADITADTAAGFWE